jgi:hypothetical protein
MASIVLMSSSRPPSGAVLEAEQPTTKSKTEEENTLRNMNHLRHMYHGSTSVPSLKDEDNRYSEFSTVFERRGA